MPLLRHYDNLNTARFVTFCCYRRNRFLTTIEIIRVFLDALCQIRDKYSFRLLGYVVMPEHVHLVLHPPDGTRLGRIIAELKSMSAAKIIENKLISFPSDCRILRNGVERRAFWQPRCYDHNCRSEQIVLEKINYCHNNPVKRGLAREPGQWHWSSYNWYIGKRDVPIVIDEFEGLKTEERRAG